MDRHDIDQQLSDIDAARRAAATAAARPLWVDAVSSALIGVGVGFGVTLTWWGVVVGLAFAAAAIVLGALTTRRRGRVTDGAAVGSGMGRYALLLLPAMLILQFLASGLDLPWRSLVGGATFGLASLLYLRLEERYQVRRLARGDLGPGDLT